MIVTPHVAAGAAIGKALRRPWLVAPAALASHFALDFIPHLDEHRLFGGPNGITRPEAVFAGVDTLVGALLVLRLARGRAERGAMILGAFSGILIDLVDNVPPWGAYFRSWPATAWLSAFHHGHQHNTRPDEWPLGFGTQATVVALAAWSILRAPARGGGARKEAEMSVGSIALERGSGRVGEWGTGREGELGNGGHEEQEARPGQDPPLSPSPTRVVSISLGSSKRDHTAEVELAGRPFLIQRIGVDGDYEKACAMITRLDGKVAAIGLGGTDLYLVAGKRRYVIEESRRLAQSARITPVVDGSGLKGTLEREAIRWLGREGIVKLAGKKVLLVSAVDRFGMAEAFTEAGCDTLFGDLIFGLGLPVSMRSLRMVRVAAALIVPVLRRLPTSAFYPTGKAQEGTRPRHARYFDWADVVAGDFHFIRRNLPARIDGKVIVTNTTTEEDVELLRERGAAMLVTTTPDMKGRSFGTNVIEGVLVALAGKRPEEIQPDEYLALLQRLEWRPAVRDFSKTEP